MELRSNSLSKRDSLDVIFLFAGEQSNDEISSSILTTVTQALAKSGWVVRRAEPHEIERWRVRSGWPAMGSEIQPGETIPAATGIVSRAVSFTKGCYPGQELVERMDSRGSSAPKSLRVIPLAELGSVQPGDAITTAGSEVGVVTSVTRDFVLAYVLRSVDLGVVVGSS
jgi:folate-binding protein YgfZ